MSNLVSALDIDDKVFELDAALTSSSSYPIPITIESEHMTVDARRANDDGVANVVLQVTRGLDGTAPATHSAGTAVSIGWGGGGGGVSVLEDRDVWEPSTVVAEGDRIAHTIDGDLHVYEVTTGGTTTSIEDSPGGFDDFNPGIAPLAEVTEPDEVVWRHLGIVGELPWDIVPVRHPEIVVDPDTHAVSIVSPEPPDESERVFTIDATIDDARVAVFDAKTDGDADWYLDENAGAGFRWSASADGVPGDAIAEINYQEFRTYKRVRMTGLPTSDPGISDRLYTDGVPSAGNPKALMVSGGS